MIVLSSFHVLFFWVFSVTGVICTSFICFCLRCEVDKIVWIWKDISYGLRSYLCRFVGGTLIQLRPTINVIKNKFLWSGTHGTSDTFLAIFDISERKSINCNFFKNVKTHLTF